MKTTRRRFLVIALGLALVAGVLLPAIPKAKSRNLRIQTAVNSIGSFSVVIGTNMPAVRQN